MDDKADKKRQSNILAVASLICGIAGVLPTYKMFSECFIYLWDLRFCYNLYEYPQSEIGCLFGPLALLGLVFGVIGLIQISSREEKGVVIAIFGVLLSIIDLFIWKVIENILSIINFLQGGLF